MVLVRPRRGGNVGAVARVMKNFGATDLWLVAPRARLGVEAARMAVHAGDVLSRHRRVATLLEAVADCTLVIGSAGRAEAGWRELPVSPRAMATEIRHGPRPSTVALVLGPEDHGLSNAELGLCQRVIEIPTAAAYPSMNLAQAASVILYELLAATPLSAEDDASRVYPGAAGARTARADRRAREGRAATSAEREAMVAHLRAALLGIGFLDPANPDHVLADLRRMFSRAGLAERDVAILRGMARQIEWAARQIGAGVRSAQRAGRAVKEG